MQYALKALALIGGVILSGCSQEEEVIADAIVRPAKLIEVAAGDQVQEVRLPAIVGAADTSILTFQVGGELQELQIIEGQQVAQGDVLARLDQRDFRNNVASAQATFDNAQIEFERAERLIAENAISQSIFDQRRSERDVAKADLDSARKQLDDSVITAPFSGIVAEMYVESFETVSARESVLTLQSAGDAEAIVQVPASLVVNIEQLVVIDQVLELDAAPEYRLPAAFVEAATVADATTQTFEARFAFTPPPNLLILPGMTGILDGRFQTSGDDGAAEEIISVPVSSVLAEAGETYVWLLDSDAMTVTRRNVEVGPGVDESVVISSGLEPGDVIVGAGGAYLYEGAEIRAFEG
ncbi:MAG: efflux RND transporter periplasmic adaptor subunit [Pseudomonadota bacterium]